MSSWPEELDAVIAAPAHHRLAMENETVRVLETCIMPGETVPLHTHQWHSVNYILSWSDVLRRDEHDNITFDSKAAGVSFVSGESFWMDPLPPHTLENVGATSVHIITVELKSGHLKA